MPFFLLVLRAALSRKAGPRPGLSLRTRRVRVRFVAGLNPPMSTSAVVRARRGSSLRPVRVSPVWVRAAVRACLSLSLRKV